MSGVDQVENMYRAYGPADASRLRLRLAQGHIKMYLAELPQPRSRSDEWHLELVASAAELLRQACKQAEEQV